MKNFQKKLRLKQIFHTSQPQILSNTFTREKIVTVLQQYLQNVSGKKKKHKIREILQTKNTRDVKQLTEEETTDHWRWGHYQNWLKNKHPISLSSTKTNVEVTKWPVLFNLLTTFFWSTSRRPTDNNTSFKLQKTVSKLWHKRKNRLALYRTRYDKAISFFATCRSHEKTQTYVINPADQLYIKQRYLNQHQITV